jgi:hypothetical protein
MTIELSPVYARLAAADDHAQRVRGLSTEWAASAIRASTTTEADGTTVYRAEVVGTPPVSIALALSDTLHQARSSLDNLVTVLRGSTSDQSTFRIDTDPAVFDEDARGRLVGVPDWAKAAMRVVQPFPDSGWLGVGEALARLHGLAIIDRHRRLLLGPGLIDINQVWASTSQPDTSLFGMHAGGRVLTLRYPADADVRPNVGADVLVEEESIRWPDLGYPAYPFASDLARSMIWGARVAVDLVAQAAADYR